MGNRVQAESAWQDLRFRVLDFLHTAIELVPRWGSSGGGRRGLGF